MSYKHTINCLKCSLLAAFLLFLQTSSGQSKFADLEQAIEQQRKALGGELIIMITGPDSILYQKSFGDFNNRTPVPIGASSQWLTAALIMQLVDEGKLSLDDNVSRYLPTYSLYARNYLTIRHCLSHQTGIQADNGKLVSLVSKKKFESLEAEVNDYAKKEIQANAGEEFRYNHMGLNIAARIAEIVTKKSFEYLIRQKLFVPLGMRNTTFSTEDGSPPSPATGAKATAADYLRFMQMILNKGTLGGKKVLSEASVAELKKIQIAPQQIKFAPKGLEGFSYTLGTWALEGSKAAGNSATSLAAPGLTGTWPMIDFNRGYACIILPKNAVPDPRAALYLGLKELIDQQLPSKSN